MVMTGAPCCRTCLRQGGRTCWSTRGFSSSSSTPGRPRLGCLSRSLFICLSLLFFIYLHTYKIIYPIYPSKILMIKSYFSLYLSPIHTMYLDSSINFIEPIYSLFLSLSNYLCLFLPIYLSRSCTWWLRTEARTSSVQRTLWRSTRVRYLSIYIFINMTKFIYKSIDMFVCLWYYLPVSLNKRLRSISIFSCPL